MKQKTLAFTISLILGSQIANANPVGGQVVHGSATFSTPNANVLNVTNSNNTVINWQSFNIGAGQTTNFIQPSATSSVLNRVVTNNPSQLLGNLNSNGRVFLINQHGILVGEGAQINTSGFVASTLNMTDSDYLNGNLRFEGDGAAGISNQGYIHAGDNGNIVLIAPNIENGGVIEVDNGNVILAAGKSITISSLENPAIQFEVTGSENTVTNLGKILANQGSASLFAGTLKHSGLIRAGGLVQNADGSISLVATDSNQVSGEVDASGSQGGYVEILGNKVDIQAGANINASGQTAGGEILIGGDQQGLNPDMQNAQTTSIAQGAIVTADATSDGNGGKVIVFATNDVHVHGDVSARGGVEGGDGGFIETSGLKSLDITSVPDASAANGNAGEWLIDPNNVTIFNGNSNNISGGPDFLSNADGALLDVAAIETALNAGTNVSVSTGGLDAFSQESGDIIFMTGISVSLPSNVSLTLNAHNDIIFDTALTASDINILATGTGVLHLNLNPNSGINDPDPMSGQVRFNMSGSAAIFNVNLDTHGGSLTINGDTSITGNGVVNLLGTNWNIQSGDLVSMQGSAPVTLNLDSTSSLINNGDLNLDSADINGNGVFENRGNINLVGVTTSSSKIDTQNLSFKNQGWIEIGLSNDLTLTGGPLDLMPGSGLQGFGTFNGDVVLNGGVIFGGNDSQTGTLFITGDLTINSGGVYTVAEVSDGILASYISSSTLNINGGDLIVNWLDSFSAANAPSNLAFSNTISILGCTGQTGCLTLGPDLNSFATVVDPITTTVPGSVDYGQTSPGNITYTFNGLDANGLVNWTGLTSSDWFDASNWEYFDSLQGIWVPGTVSPSTSNDVFIHNSSAYTVDIVGNTADIRGMQAKAQLTIGAGGALNISGNAFVLNPYQADGGLKIAAADAKVTRTGAGVLYNLGATLKLDQGILSADAVNWGEIQTSVGTSFQLDGNLVNNALFAIDANSGINTFTGTGSIDNRGIMSWANGASLTLDGVSLSSASSNAVFQGAGLLSLKNGSVFAVNKAPQTYDKAINWDLIGGSISSVENIAALPNVVSLSSGALIQGAGAIQIPNTTTFTVTGTGGGFQGTGSVNSLAVDVTGSILVSAGQLTLDNTSLAIQSGASLTGAGSVDIGFGSTLIADGTVDISGISLTGGTLTAGSQTGNSLSYAGDISWHTGTVDGIGLTTSGNVDLYTGVLNTDWTIAPGGTVNWASPSYADLQINNATIDNQGSFIISSYVDLIAQKLAGKNFASSTGTVKFNNQGLLVIDSGITSSTQDPDTVIFDIPFDNVGGTIAIKSGTFRIESGGVAQTLQLDAGESLQGYGTFDGNVINAAGTVSPGKSDLANAVFDTGTLTINGDFTQQANGTLVIKLDSTASGLLHDTLNVAGTLNAGGDIRFAVVNGKTATQLALLLDQSFTPLTYGSFANKFATVDIPTGLNFTFSDTGTITITSSNQDLIDISNQLEVLFDNVDLDHRQMVRAMRFIDRIVSVERSDEEDDEKKRAPRLVCK